MTCHHFLLWWSHVERTHSEEDHRVYKRSKPFLLCVWACSVKSHCRSSHSVGYVSLFLFLHPAPLFFSINIHCFDEFIPSTSNMKKKLWSANTFGELHTHWVPSQWFIPARLTWAWLDHAMTSGPPWLLVSCGNVSIIISDWEIWFLQWLSVCAPFGLIVVFFSAAWEVLITAFAYWCLILSCVNNGHTFRFSVAVCPTFSLWIQQFPLMHSCIVLITNGVMFCSSFSCWFWVCHSLSSTWGVPLVDITESSF